MTNCFLLSHLETRKRLAKARKEVAEVRRLESEITKHRAKCITCAGVESTSLVLKFFNHPVVIVSEEKR